MGIVPNKKAPLSKYFLIAGISIPFAVGFNNILTLSNLAEYSIAYQETAEALYTPSFLVQIVCLGLIVPITEEQYQKKIDDAIKLGENQASATAFIDMMSGK